MRSTQLFKRLEMKIVSSFSEYQKALSLIKPHKIAVAYIGADYNNFINIKNLKEIIISPTIGSNPHAISSLIKSIGLSNVHFIDNLHSKLYIGKSGVIIGSANLSRNALDANELIELGVLFQTPKDLNLANKLFAEYKKNAMNSYPSPLSKENKLAKLFNTHHRWTHFHNDRGIKLSPKPKTLFNDYEWGIDEPFKLSWYEVYPDDEDAYNKKRFYKEFPGVTWNDIYGNILADMEIPKGDKINEGEWLLTFHRDDNSRCKKTGLEWMFIDKKIKNAFRKGYHPDSVMQLTDIKHSTSPFLIDKKFRAAFADVVNQDKYRLVRETMYIKSISPYIPKILKEIKNKY